MNDQNSDYCRSRAAVEKLAGDTATLANVRDRCRRSEAAWIAMAERSERSARLRDVRAQERIAAAALDQ